jgi:hypothetical protein
MKKLLLLAITAVVVLSCNSITDPLATLRFGPGHEEMSPDPDCPGLTVSQCRAKHHKACTTVCDSLYAAAMEAAWVEHKRILAEECGPLPWVEEEPCRAAEHARYAQVKRQIEDDKTACKQACDYSEGGGTGGR